MASSLLFLLVEEHPGCSSLSTSIHHHVKQWNYSKTHSWLMHLQILLSSVDKYVTIFLILFQNLMHMHCSVLLDIIKLTCDKNTLTLNIDHKCVWTCGNVSECVHCSCISAQCDLHGI